MTYTSAATIEEPRVLVVDDEETRTAAETGKIDFILPAPKIGPKLFELLR